MKYKFPNQGGCWFCYMDDDEMYFSIEFDTYFHMGCLKKELETGNPEAEIIATEHKIPFESKFPDPDCDDGQCTIKPIDPADIKLDDFRRIE